MYKTQEKKKSKKNKKDKKDKRDKDKDGSRHHHSKHGDKDKHASRKGSIDHDSADEEGQVLVGGKAKEKVKGEGGSPATKKPRVEEAADGDRVAAVGDGDGAAHKVEENGNGSAAVPL